jgi:DnaJ-class molecular chaperone
MKEKNEVEEVIKKMKEEERVRIQRPPGYYSNEIIRIRNGGVRHQFEDDIGGCSANYK